MRKFWHLSWADRRLLLNAGVWLAVYRVALWLLPWNRVAAMRLASRKPSAKQVSVERIEWAIRNARRLVPGANCLTKALALHHLLSRANHESIIHIGVAKTPDRGFEAHAWVEHDGVTLLNSPSEIAHYSRLLAFQAPSP